MIWKLIFEIVGCILLLALVTWTPVAVMYWGLYRNRGNQEPAKVLDGGRIEFAPTRFKLLTSALIEAWILYGAIAYLSHHHDRSWSALIVLGVGLSELAAAAEIPGTIVVGHDGLEQVYWFRWNTHIRWDEVCEINTGEKIRIVTITGTNGTKIVHSGHLADRPRLLQEIKQHCGDQLPPDFPREPMEESKSEKTER